MFKLFTSKIIYNLSPESFSILFLDLYLKLIKLFLITEIKVLLIFITKDNNEYIYNFISNDKYIIYNYNLLLYSIILSIYSFYKTQSLFDKDILYIKLYMYYK
jgi:hypothetical protein